MITPGSRSTLTYPFPKSTSEVRNNMRQLVEFGWKLNRTAVNPDTDLLVERLVEELGATVLAVPSGERCLTWRIPRHWRVRSGRLLTMEGTVLADYQDNPLTLWTHSVPFSGVVERSELLEHHVVTDPARPDEILYHYRNGYNFAATQWGFSLPWRVAGTLMDEHYRVEIDADLDLNGSMKVVDAVLPGELTDTVTFMAHTCHPALVSDGIANIAIAVELYKHIASLPRRTYSYRFLFGPEYFAAAAYLEKAPRENVAALKYGVYLDMLSSHEPIGWQSSMQGNSYIDAVLDNVMRTHAPQHIAKEYRGMWGNDEMFYNGQGYWIPTAGVGRCMHREYHYDSDNMENMSLYHMEESLWILRRMVEVMETDQVPVPCYMGPVCQSEHGIYIDPAQDRHGARQMEHILSLADGRRSYLDMVGIAGGDFFKVRNMFETLQANGLCTAASRKPRPEDQGTLAPAGR